MDIFKQLNKTNEEIEHFVYLFEECNLNCSFCWQDHDDIKGKDDIISRANDINNLLSKNPTNHHLINIMGGELFHDNITDDVFCDYYALCENIVAYAKDNHISISFTFVTNLVYQNLFRVISLIYNIRQIIPGVSLTTSYDPVGRFNESNKSLFLKNLRTVLIIDKNLISNVSVVMTRPNIKYLVTNEDSDLDWMYDNFDVYFDYYSPNQTAPHHTPKESELLRFFKWLIIKYPNAGPIQSWKDNRNNPMSCRRSMIVGPNGNQGRCCSLLNDFSKEEKNRIPIFNISDNTDLERFYVEQKGCLSCEFFSKCTIGCFLIHTHEMCNDMGTECLYKTIFLEHPEWPK